jgi:flagellar motor switch protein FliN/FliY
MTTFDRTLFGAFVEELGIVLGAMIDSPATVAPGAPVAGRQWVAQIRLDGPLGGTMTAVLDRPGAAAITALMTGIEGEPSDEVVLDTLREVMAQAASALALAPVAKGATLTVAEVAPAEDREPDGERLAFAIGAEKLGSPLAVTLFGGVAPKAAESVAAAAAPASTPAPAEPAPATDDRIGVILDIDLPLVVRFGRTEMPLRQLTRLGPGSVIDLGRSPDDPVDVLVSNRVVARGEVVVVSGSYGIRILDVVSQRDRVRSMEA